MNTAEVCKITYVCKQFVGDFILFTNISDTKFSDNLPTPYCLASMTQSAAKIYKDNEKKKWKILYVYSHGSSFNPIYNRDIQVYVNAAQK